MSVTCGLDFERRVAASAFDVRRAIAEALREIGFEITVDQLTRIEAKRGGMLGYSLMMKKQMPVRALFEIAMDGTTCAIAAHLTDNIKTIGKTWGVNRQYRGLLDEVRGRLDAAFAGLDGAAAKSFAEAKFWSRSGDVGVLEQTNDLTARAVGGAVGVASKAIDGSPDTLPKAWKGVDSVTFKSAAGVAVLTLAETQARLGVAVMIASHPGSMPENLARDVEVLAASVETALTSAAGRAAVVEIPPAQRPVFEFLSQQAEIRAELPVRQLHICRSCRLEKITNPAYERIAARNEKIGDIVAGVGATIGKGGISPTFVLGQVFKLKRLDPDYVCARCQGMEADERVVTFCPSCADLARDVVLRICPKCKFDYRTKADPAPVWSAPAVEVTDGGEGAAEPAAAPAPAPEPGPAPEAAQEPAPSRTAWRSAADVPVGRPEIGARGGKICQACRREFPTLWRVVIGTHAGYEERLICGSTFTCQMVSLVPATQV